MSSASTRLSGTGEADCGEARGQYLEVGGSGTQVVEMNKEQRRAAALEAEDLCWDETYAFEAWRDSLETVPTIKVRLPTTTLSFVGA